MIEMMLDKYILYVLMGCAALLGIVSKVTAGITLKRLVKAAGNMSKSPHPFMRLVRAKFEHACMVSDRVENVEVFVGKYLYEYKVAGIRLHTLRRMETACAGVCLVLGAAGAFLEYVTHGMQDGVLQAGGTGAALAVLVYAVHLVTDERYRLEAVKNYMVDYLQNVCLRRYEKNFHQEMRAAVPEVPVLDFGETDPDNEVQQTKEIQQQVKEAQWQAKEAQRQANEVKKQTKEVQRQIVEKEEKAVDKNEPVRPTPGKEVPSPRTSPEIKPPVMPDPYEVPDVTPPVRAAKADKKMTRGKKEDVSDDMVKNAPKDVLIRQILEEFMA